MAEFRRRAEDTQARLRSGYEAKASRLEEPFGLWHIQSVVLDELAASSCDDTDAPRLRSIVTERWESGLL